MESYHEPPSLFDPPGAAERDDAIDRADRNAHQWWRGDAERAARSLASSRPFFTSEDVLARLDSDADAPRTHDTRALGAIMRKLHRDGVIEPTARFVPSERPSRHRAPVRVWRAIR